MVLDRVLALQLLPLVLRLRRLELSQLGLFGGAGLGVQSVLGGRRRKLARRCPAGAAKCINTVAELCDLVPRVDG